MNDFLQASKWIKIQLLLDSQEMESLLKDLGDFYIFLAGSICEKGKAEVSKQEFLSSYHTYVSALKMGLIPEEAHYKKIFSAIFTVALDHLHEIALEGNKQIVRLVKPVIQLQNHRFDYSAIDGKFRSMVLGQQTILWGIQFSYPILYKDSRTQEIMKVTDTPMFPNTHLFHKLQKWSRAHTIPTSFVVNGVVTNVPMRLGKECRSWINQHPQLGPRGLFVK